jgi:putative ATPase
MTTKHKIPLAELLRPTHWSDMIGQQHLLGPGKPLRVAFEQSQLHSMILWGPPGVGKTSLARLTATAFNYAWIPLSAVFSGVKDIRAAMSVAESNQANQLKTILFIDEIHRFNKAQQDALLPYTESGLIVLIGATTENPSFELNKALLSRAQVYVLHALTLEDLDQLLTLALQKINSDITFDKEAREHLLAFADGDARRLLNMLGQIESFCSTQAVTCISVETLTHVLSCSARRFDKSGDVFYDQISALHKAVRGSDPDAALYWFCRMLDGGADPVYLARRIVRMAWEDIGLADPRAQQIANDAALTYERLGSPEGELALAQALIYLAVAPKSNAGYVAYHQAKSFVEKDTSREVPMHLRPAPTELLRRLGHGKNYRYAHDEPHGFAAGVRYLPDGMKEPNWYQPTNRGLEIKISEKMSFLRKLAEKV